MKPRTLLKKWADQVKEKDEFQCQVCGSKNKLHAHHIIPRKNDESLWYEIKNGITLCNSCHAKTEGFKSGRIVSEDIKNKIRQSCKGRQTWSKGKNFSEEHIKKLRESHLGKKLSEETKNKLKGKKAWNKGIKAPEHVRKSLIEANLKTWEKRKELGLPGPRKGTKNSEETRKKLSESLKKAYAEGRRKSIKGTKRK